MKINRSKSTRPYRADDFDENWSLFAIVNVEIQKDVESKLNGSVNDCYILHFAGTGNTLFLRDDGRNVNLERLMNAYGDEDTDQWIDKKIMLRRIEKGNREDCGMHGVIDLGIPSFSMVKSNGSSPQKKRHWRRGHWVNDEENVSQG